MDRAEVNPSQIEADELKDSEEIQSFKYLLGEFGIAMLVAISRGARDGNSITMLSGVPAACISGRIPVLLNLNLVDEVAENDYRITKIGEDFLAALQ